tara:strand:- start:455 stop:1138 length:684 start_codon:yes stop_codon:yes gene_type:complete
MKITHTIAVIAATTLSVNAAATVANYTSGFAATAGTTGAAVPTGQGWAFNGTLSAFSYGADSTIEGWRVTDGTVSSAAFYQATIATGDAAAMSANDWTATWTATLNHDAVSSGGVDDYYNTARQVNNAMWIEVSGSFRYILFYGVDANGDTTLNDGVTGFLVPGLVTTNAGTLIAVFDIRHDSFGDLEQLLTRRSIRESVDNGGASDRARRWESSDLDAKPRGSNEA